jgi:hypothetical protein
VNVSREQIALALYNLLSSSSAGVNAQIAKAAAAGQISSDVAGAAQIKGFFRRGKMYSNVPKSDQPALFLLHIADEGHEPQAYGAQNWTLHFLAIVILRADGDPESEVDTTVNAILDATDAVLSAGDGAYGQQTLGGIVQSASIEGVVTIDTEIIQQQIAITIPIRCVTGS